MKESMWGIAIIAAGAIGIALIMLFQNITNKDSSDLTLLRESAKAAMYDAVDLAAYRKDGVIRIDREKFVENFVRRFADSAASATYEIEIYDVNELPPKVSIQVTSKVTGGAFGKNETYEITQTLDAILESPYDELN
ncbi:MAG: DUF5411 family protein [Bacillales bacterium]|nr:DUF5411 family protein [Bacillales bacterium]